MNATFGTWKVAVAGALALLAQTVPQAQANEFRPVPVTVNRPVAVAQQSANAPVYGPAPAAPAAPAAKSAAANGEVKTAFWGCWNPCYTQPVCRPVYPTYPTYPPYPTYPAYPYGYGPPGYGYGTPGYGYGTPGYGVGYGVGYGPSYGVPGYGAYGVGVSGPAYGAPTVLPTVAPVTAPVVAPTVNPVYPGVAPLAPVAPYSPFYGSKDSGKVNANVPVDVTRRARATSSPYFE